MSVVPYSNGYSYRKKLTVDHTKVSGSANISNFILYFTITDSTLKNTSNGGNVVDGTYTDIRVEDTSGTHLQQEISFYDGVNGVVRGWAKIPTLSYTTDTDFYVYYGKTISATEDNGSSLWADWHAVHHFEDYGYESKGSGYNFSSGDISGATKVTNTPVGAGYSFDGVNDYINFGNYARWSYKITYSMWIKTSTTGQQSLFTNDNNTTKYVGVMLGPGYTNNSFTARTGNNTGAGGGNRNSSYGSTTITDGNWHKIDIELTGYNSTKIYVDGVAETVTYSGTSTTIAYDTYSGSNQATMGRGQNGSSNYFPYNGVVTQMKVVNDAIPYSADYLKTEYANQGSVGTFITIGDEEFVAKEDITGSAFIQHQNNVVLYGNSRIEKINTKIMSGNTRIEKVNTKTISGVARIEKISNSNISGISRIEKINNKTLAGNSRIEVIDNIAQSGVARIEIIKQSLIYGVSRIESINDIDIVGNSRIGSKKYAKVMGFGAYYGWGATGFGGGVKKSPKTLSKTISGVSRIEKTIDLDIFGLARIEKINSTDITGNAYLYYVRNTNIYGEAIIDYINSSDVSGISRIERVESVDILGNAFLNIQRSSYILGEAIIDNQNDLDISGNSRIEIIANIAIVGISKISNPKPDKLPAIWEDNSTKTADNWSGTDKKEAIWVISNVKKVNEWSGDNDKARSNWTDSDDKKETDWRRNYYE